MSKNKQKLLNVLEQHLTFSYWSLSLETGRTCWTGMNESYMRMRNYTILIVIAWIIPQTKQEFHHCGCFFFFSFIFIINDPFYSLLWCLVSVTEHLPVLFWSSGWYDQQSAWIYVPTASYSILWWCMKSTPPTPHQHTC